MPTEVPIYNVQTIPVEAESHVLIEKPRLELALNPTASTPNGFLIEKKGDFFNPC